MNSIELFFLTLLALLPFFILPYFILGRGFQNKDIAFLTSLLMAVIAVVVWRVGPIQVIACYVKGLWIAYELCLIALCGFLYQQPLRQSRSSSIIRGFFSSIHPDKRVQAILVGCFLGGFTEYILGFGATGGLGTIILAGLGFPPTCAIVVAMMGSVPGAAFNSAGSPLLIGVTQGMQDPAFTDLLAAKGLDVASYVRLVTAEVGIIHGVVGVFMPLFIVMMMTRFYGPKRSFLDGLDIAPFAIFAGLAFAIPYALTAIFFGPEFPSLVGSVVGFAITAIVAKINSFVPFHKWEFEPEAKWPHQWAPTKPFKPEALAKMPAWLAWMPYFGLGFFILITRVPQLGIGPFLNSFSFEWHNIFGTSVSVVSHSFYMPCTVLVVIMVIANTIAFKLNSAQIRAFSLPALIPTASMVDKAPFATVTAFIFMYSSVNHSQMPGMAKTIADGLCALPGSNYWSPFFVTAMAALGTTAGTNNTFSNILLSQLAYNFEHNLNAPVGLMVALQVAGASVGTLVAMRYLTSTVTVCNMLTWEGPIMHKNVIPAILCVLLLGVAGVFIYHYVDLDAWLLPYVISG
ncbi:MAG: L-lactate permease [bacterium]